MLLKNPTLFFESFLLAVCLVFLVVSGSPRILFGREIPPGFTRLDSPEPPHRSVFALLEDGDGFLWIGTQDGLARYDGYEMRTLRHNPNDPSSLSNSSIRTLLEDARGRIWVGTENGLNLLDRRTFEIRLVETPGHPTGRGAWYYCSFEDRDGTLWFGTDDGLIRYEPDSTRIRVIRHAGNSTSGLLHATVVGIQQDSEGSIWAATSDLSTHALHRLTRQGETEERTAFDGPGSRHFAFLIDSKDRFWTHPMAPLSSENPLRPAGESRIEEICPEARAIIERADKTIWSACDDRLYRTDPESGGVSGQLVVPTGGAWLENFGRSLLEDDSGTLWVGTEGGLFRLDPDSKRFFHRRRDPKNPHTLSADTVSALAEAPEGDLWVATYGGGLNRVKRATGHARHFCTDSSDPEHCTGNVIWHLHTSSDGTLWIAGDELWSLDPIEETLTLHSPPGVIDGYLVFIVEDDRGVLWIGGLGGRLYRHTIATGVFEVIELSLAQINAETRNRLDSLLLEEKQLLIGFGGALGAYDTESGEMDLIPLESPEGADLGSLGTWVIYRGIDKRLWLGTAAGLLRWRPDGPFEIFTTHNGLPGSAVYSILEGSDGALWMGTNQGLARLNPDAPPDEQFRSFTTADGIGNVEFNRHAALECADGTMYFGGMDGLTEFHPTTIRDNRWVPPVHITKIEVSSREGTRTVEPGTVDRLVLAPGDTTVGFTIAALNFTGPELNHYAYRLEGFDTSWTQAETRRTTQYTNLPPGRYRFRVRGSNNDGVWNEDGASLEIVVLPSLWETWWFRPLLIVLVAGAAWMGLGYRKSKKREMARLRMRIAGDLHDDLSSDLSGIAVLADMVRQADTLGNDERSDLVNIRNASLNMADGLRDIVWYIDPDHDSLEATVRRMRSVASTLLRGRPHEFLVNLPERAVPLPVDTRRNVFLIFKEAVHNIVRHAEASEVVIEIAVSGNRMQMRITDDGRGFNPEEETGGHGLRSMHRRADEEGGRLEIVSKPGSGTTLRLSVEMAGSRDG